MENLTECKIMLPTPEEGCEITNGIAQDGEKAAYWNGSTWGWRTAAVGISYPFLARRKRTLADWANDQPLFQALAKMRGDANGDLQTVLFGSHGDAWWRLIFSGTPVGLFNLGCPPESGSLILESGRWEVAS
jgi:hypothetical protein